MWEIRNRTPYAASGNLILDKTGRKHWLVTVRGTFEVTAEGKAKVAGTQDDPIVAPEYSGDDGESSLLREADVVAEKPYVDVVVTGSAHAPAGRAVTSVNIGLQTPFFRKLLTVQGERVWTRNAAGFVVPGDPLPFSSVPVTYERAYGGYDKSDDDPRKHRLFARNPVGRGFAGSRDSLVGGMAPSVAYAGKEPADGAPAGFGPLCSYWSPRDRFAGTYDAAWIEKRKPLLPLDFDPQFHNCAPDDQQIRKPYLGGGVFSVVNMTPGGTMRVEVPKVVFGMATYFGSKVDHHRGTLKTVALEPETKTLALVWQSTLECHTRFDDLDFTTIDAKTVLS